MVAEAYASPNHMVRTVLAGQRSIEAAWRGAPTANGNAFAFESSRSNGYVAQMDPERNNSGFSRSIVLKKGLASSDVLRNARGSALGAAAAQTPADAAALVPTLAGSGIEIGAPELPGLDRGGWQDQLPDPIQDR